MEVDRLALHGFGAALGSVSNDSDDDSIDDQANYSLPAKSGHSKTSLKEFLQGDTSTGYIPSAQRGTNKPSAGYLAFLEKSGKLKGSNSGLAFQHPITPIAEGADKSRFYNPPALNRNLSYDSYSNLPKYSASATFPPRGFKHTTARGNKFSSSFPAASHASPPFNGISLDPENASQDADVTAELLSSPIKEMQKNLRAAASSTRVASSSEIYNANSLNQGDPMASRNQTPSTRKCHSSSGNISGLEDFDHSFNSVGSRKVSSMELRQHSRQGKTANDAIRERAANSSSSHRSQCSSSHGKDKNGEPSSGEVYSRKERDHKRITDHVTSRSSSPYDGPFASGALPVDRPQDFRSTSTSPQNEGEQVTARQLHHSTSARQSHTTPRQSVEAGTEEKSQERRKSSSRFGFGVFRNMKDKNDAKKAKKAEEKGKGKEKMEHDPINEPLSFELVPLSKLLEQASNNFATLKSVHAKINEETACCGGIAPPVDFAKLETRINGFHT